ncbi:cytochrome P450 71A9-like isoform X2 [Punica granatum]|uniref:Cytochrome P450 71A9-like isoform X2 n=1 Tax=Punica granatum TaxID=22663 RepID=A0A6P8C307_PUNGR|nr:cytochrome P450 71A9-like isoform X2 [Punica granatum]
MKICAFSIIFLSCTPLGQAKDLPPGPPCLPVIGNLHQLDCSAVHRSLWKLSKTYGPLMSLKIGSIPFQVVSSARMAREIIKNHDPEFSARPQPRVMQKLSYNGLDVAFTSYPDKYWREMRRLYVLHVFSPKRVQSSQSIREDEVSKMIMDISRYASSSKAINLSKSFLSLTSTIISRIAFRKDYTSRKFTNADFYWLLHEALALLASLSFEDYFPVVGGMIDHFTGLPSRIQRVFGELDSFYETIIKEHLTRDRAGSEEQDIIDFLLQLRQDNKSSSLDITTDRIKAIIMNIFIGGTDTNAATLEWAMTALRNHPGVMTRLQEETRALFGHKDFISEDDLPSLPYLTAVVKETLRLYPPVPLLLPRQTASHCTIDCYNIKPKSRVLFNAFAIGMDPEYWGSDPEAFFPERFMDSSVDFKGQDFGLIPFGSGRRGCPGVLLASHVVELALANLANSFDWELPQGMEGEAVDTEAAPGTTTHRKTDLCLLPKMKAHYSIEQEPS